MRGNSHQYDAFELLPADVEERYTRQPARLSTSALKEDHTADRHDYQDGATTATRIRRLPGIKQLSYFLPLIISAVPIALLLAFSGKLSRSLAKSACTPGGDFVMPYNSSTWDTSSFFEITIPFLGPEPSTCSHSSLDPFSIGECTGYSFTQVKVIDLAWDVLVGRGGQALLVFIAYRVFSRVLASFMEHGEVGYDAFATVAFETGTFSSIIPLFRHVVGLTPIPRTLRAVLTYAGMLLATAYIVAVPSLISAMTGYTTLFTPFVRFGSAQLSNGTLVDCYPGFLPVWGRMGVQGIQIEEGQIPGLYPIVGTNTSIISYEESFMWIDYYHRYESVYDECHHALDISSCKAARQATTISWAYPGGFQELRVQSPMPGILPYPNDTDSKEPFRYRYWQCGYENLIDSHGLVQSPDFDPVHNEDDQSVGVCQADSKYAWGFSFLLTFLVALLQLLFAVLMYALWLLSRRDRKENNRVAAPGTFPDAVTLVTQAQKQYGVKLDEWSATGLKREILSGKIGMSFVGDEGLRKRKAEQSQALGDAHGGDWGGDVVVDDRRW